MTTPARLIHESGRIMHGTVQGDQFVTITQLRFRLAEIGPEYRLQLLNEKEKDGAK